MAEQAALDQPVFSIDDRVYTWRDIVAYARLLGIWDEIEERRPGEERPRRRLASTKRRSTKRR